MTGRSDTKKPSWATKSPEQVKKIELLKEIDQLEKQYELFYYRSITNCINVCTKAAQLYVTYQKSVCLYITHKSIGSFIFVECQ